MKVTLRKDNHEIVIEIHFPEMLLLGAAAAGGIVFKRLWEEAALRG